MPSVTTSVSRTQVPLAMDAKIATILGGADEAATFSAYSGLLSQMIANRRQAFELGETSAEQEILTLQKQLARIQ